jgi:hypothetical protein
MMDRTLDEKRKTFLKDHVRAQMVAYENVDSGVSTGWFYWTLKMEGGAFAEWDFSRGVNEGWITKLPAEDVSSERLYGTCHEIAEDTIDDMSIVHQSPDPADKRDTYEGPPIDDDYVVSHAGTSKIDDSKENSNLKPSKSSATQTTKEKKHHSWFRFCALLFLCYGVWKVFLKDEYGFGRRRAEYTPLHATQLNI